MKKTNAMRMVERQKIKYDLIEYAIDDGQIDGLSVAEKTAQDPAIVFKTLVVQTNAQEIAIFLLPLTKELDVKQAAKVVGAKKIDLLPLQELTKVTGYERGGCAPIGMRKAYPTYLDQTAEHLHKMIVSAGKPGLQMKLSPTDLIGLTKATLVQL